MRRYSKFNTNKEELKISFQHSFFVSIEILQAVFALFIIFWQFYLSISLNNDKISMLDSSSYKFIIDHLLDFEMITEFKFVPLDESCTKSINDPFHDYIFRKFDGVNNTCIENKYGINVLRFEPGCTQYYKFNETSYISIFGGSKVCYRSSPKINYVYTFVSSNSRCQDGYLTCGYSNKTTLCLQKNQKVTQCPVIRLKVFNNLTLSSGYYLLKELNLYRSGGPYIAFTNYTTSITPMLSIKMGFESFNDINYYDYYDEEKQHIGDFPDLIFANYSMNYDPDGNYLDMNPYYNGKQSKYVSTLSTMTLSNSFKWMNMTRDSSVYILYQTIPTDMKFSLSATFLTLPNDTCIEMLFLNKTSEFYKDDNNSRGLFSVLSDISFEFLHLNIVFYITWNITQLGTYIVYFLIYRVSILRDKFNYTISKADRNAEQITTITLKLFFYLCMTLKLFILYNIRRYSAEKKQIIKFLVDYQCFIHYLNPLEQVFPDNSLVHIHLKNFLNSSIFVTFLKKCEIIYVMTFIEIGNEVVNLFFILCFYYRENQKNEIQNYIRSSTVNITSLTDLQNPKKNN